jgi:hypothetical protein
MKTKVVDFCFLFAVLLLSFWAIKPLFHFGFFPIHDDTQVVRVAQMSQALKDGQFPVRWVKDLGYGYGYPIFNFYAPLPYYVGAFFNLLGFDALVATKIMMGLGIVLAGVFMFFLAKEFWGRFGGLVSALFYVYAPYHAVDVYVRGAVGEFWAMAMLPLVFLGIYRIFQKDCWGIIIASLGFSGIILSHNLTAMMTTPFVLLEILILFILSKNKRQFGIWSLEFGFFSLGLSAFYWLPAIFEMKYTNVFSQIGGGADFRDHFVFLDQLWASPWGFGGSAWGRLDGMSFMIGKIHILSSFLALILGGLLGKESRILVLFSGVSLLLAIFLTNRSSLPIWEIIKPMAFIQYPWRFLIFASFFSSFLAGSIINLRLKKVKWWPPLTTGIFIGCLFFLNIKYFRPQMFFKITAADYLSEENIKWRTSKISDEYLPKNFPVPKDKSEIAWKKIEIISGQVEIKNISNKSHFLKFDTEAMEPAEILINNTYFPGWKVWVNRKEEKPRVEEGKIKIKLNAGRQKVFLKFNNTPVRNLANFLSLLSLVGLVWFVLEYKHAGAGVN